MKLHLPLWMQLTATKRFLPKVIARILSIYMCIQRSFLVFYHMMRVLFAEAVSCLNKAVDFYLEIGRLNMAARYCKVCKFFVLCGGGNLFMGEKMVVM